MVSATQAVLVVTLLLVVDTVLAGMHVLPAMVHLISVVGLVLVPWMVVVVLRDTSVRVRDLESDEEWGYQDRPDLRPGR